MSVEPGMPLMLTDPTLRAAALRDPRMHPLPFPMDLIRPHEDQARRNHGQTLERLRERGGLAPSELLAILEDRPWRSVAEVRVLERLADFIEDSLGR